MDVTDDVLGEIGAIDELEPGGSATLTTTMVVEEDSPTRNVATAARPWPACPSELPRTGLPGGSDGPARTLVSRNPH